MTTASSQTATPVLATTELPDHLAPISREADYPDYCPPSRAGTPAPGGGAIVYRRRWYILLVFSLLTGTQGGLWNTWGPLAESVQTAFDWSTGTIALQTNWGPIAYIVSIVFFTWLIDVKGLRWACLITAALVFAGTLLRCITSTPPAATWLIHMGQLLNGLGGPVAMGGPPALSAVWFPAHQRTTATAIGSISNGLGIAVSFIIGPLLVPSVDNSSTPHNHTSLSTVATLTSDTSAVGNSTPPDDDVSEVRANIMCLMYIEAGWAGAVFLAILVYFPARPPSPPSITAATPRLNFKAGLLGLFRHDKFWLLGVTYALSTGIFYGWESLLTLNLKPVGVSEVEAGWMGFYASLVANVAGMIIAFCADLFSRRLKWFLICLYTVALVCFIVFALECAHVLPFHNVVVNLTNILANVGIGGAVPLLYELVCESTYPIAEGVTNGLMTWLNNVVALVFYFFMMIPHATSRMNWVVIGSTAVCIPIFFLYKERYTRLDIDINKADTDPPQPPDLSPHTASVNTREPAQDRDTHTAEMNSGGDPRTTDTSHLLHDSD